MKVALCGTWHVHAKQYVEAARKNGSTVIGVFEENADWRRDFCEKNELAEFTTFEQLLQSDAEGVIVCTATNVHTEYILRLIAAGKHIFTEKVLALTVEDCEKIRAALANSNVRFVISYPQRYQRGPLTVRSVIESGELGRINYLRFRNCHAGSSDGWLPAHFYNAQQCGGGAMIDLGAHGMYLTDWLLGTPVSYSSTFTSCRGSGVEDNAVTVMQYADGTIAINETGFVSAATPASLEVGGERGFVRYVGPKNTKVCKCTKDTENQLVEVELVAAQPSPIEQFVKGISLPGCGIEEACRLTAMMVGAYANQK